MSKSRVKPTPRRKEDDLLVFGYACTIHEDSSKALHFEQEKHLIPWMGDEKFLIDRSVMESATKWKVALWLFELH